MEDVIYNNNSFLPSDGKRHRRPGAGRPPIYNNADDLQKAVDKYFDETCHPVVSKDGDVSYVDGPYTMAGLALALGLSRMTLLRYEDKDVNMSVVVTRAKQRVEDWVEGQLFNRDGSNGAKFALSNNHEGWKEQPQSLPGSLMSAEDAGKLINGMASLFAAMAHNQQPIERNITPDIEMLPDA